VDAVSRRLELLKLEGLGFSQLEIVKELSIKCACSERTVYSDFESRESWQPIVQSVIDSRKVLLKVVNRYEQIYRQASMRLLTFQNELAQLAALNTMLKANAMLCETAVFCRCRD
jgi:transcriptional antiterminator